MITELKRDIAKDIKSYMDKNLYNHRKEKEGLISCQNMLLNELTQMIDEWVDKK